MPRQARIDAPGVLHHIICRGIERRCIFPGDEDRKDFVTRLETVLAATGTPCYAWALMPNHVHLLLRTGATPISDVMRRLLTGYAVAFNRRHQRSGHLFQNRYKSIICQENLYLLELVRYIHLNPLRAGLVKTMAALAEIADSGHRQLLGLTEQGVVSTDEVLALFSSDTATARRQYAAFVADGAEQGERLELMGGGLIRNPVKQVPRDAPVDTRTTSDPRILGAGEFVEAILQRADEQLTRRQRYQAAGIGLETLAACVSELLLIEAEQIYLAGKQPRRVQARSLFCYWAVRELGHTATALARRLGISQPAVSQAVRRGEKMAAERGWTLQTLIKL